ncbi:hypothetical protein AB205_0016590 [Aquarana catesbeiana]|uniref:Uncharacterized protein n=1 Tax=Aquarana catesbeiana TaxID=8400 RepID=A0A2G9RVH5_AQUCT|nr:hypothetical protein AB205_0016590 [Aquarana catesbeiana]
MKRHQKRDVHHGDIKRLCQQMHAYSDSSVRMIYEYYKDDLMNILGNIDTHALLSQLSEKNVLNAELLPGFHPRPKMMSYIPRVFIGGGAFPAKHTLLHACLSYGQMDPRK